MTTCAAEGCEIEAAYKSRTRPAWCDQHITAILLQGGLVPVEPFTKRDAYRLTRCTTCGCEAHYKFGYVLDKNAIREPVCRACYWRQWAADARRMAGTAEVPVDIPEVHRHAELNGLEYLGPLTNPSLPDDPHRTRCKTCGKIEAERPADMGWGCGSCRSNPKRQTPASASQPKAQNLLRDSDNEAVSWWDHDVNPESLWQTAKLRSPKQAHWRCPVCDTRFTAVIREMTGHPWQRSCPACQAAQDRENALRRAELDTKTVADIPELARQWADPTPPDQVSVLEFGLFKFRCPNGHQPSSRPERWLAAGCPSCRGNATRKANAAAAQANPTFSRLSPEISSQWHPIRNGGWQLAEASPESRRIAWWKDPVCGHEWRATPRERDKYDRLRCPECRTVLDSLAFHYPELAAEWAPENKTSAWHVRPTGAIPGQQPMWVCPNDPTHRWQASPASRIAGSTCPECQESGKSMVELAHLAEARRIFGNAASGKRITSDAFTRRGAWTVDILVDLENRRQIAIEYDGSYWHAGKIELDADKSRDLLAAGLTVVRLREAPLPTLAIDNPAYHELTVYSQAPNPAGTIEQVNRLVGR
ncbi:zinc-ribbon domain-containing protein [Nocardia huaxiensis]|uniref:zinc-ribbon domain-containing protein n=1 Tax=Nocardia huaxiensis TaxID=2755382 RepID=UPI001E2832B3|nr:zinc-ribbon domain-containing protein [Nocardia huaxiensis]UFS97090.1 lysine biosynthesis protein LysW [Nocardia huaxiensis]